MPQEANAKKFRQALGGHYATLAVCMSNAQADGIRMAARVAGLSTSRYLNELLADKLREVVPDEEKAEPLEQTLSIGQTSRRAREAEAIYPTTNARAAMPPKALSVRLPLVGSGEITRSLMGDPAPGRSALDRRERRP